MLLSDLPIELLAQIADALDVFEIDKFALVCSTFHAASSAAIRHHSQTKQNHVRLCVCDEGLISAGDDMFGAPTYGLMDAIRLLRRQPHVAQWVTALVVVLSDIGSHIPGDTDTSGSPIYEETDLRMLQESLSTFSLNERLIHKERHQTAILVMLIMLLPRLSTLVWDSQNVDYRALFHMLDDVQSMSPVDHSIKISHVVIRRLITEPFPDDRTIYYFMKWPSIRSLELENCHHGFSDRIYLTNNRSWAHLPVMSNLTKLCLIDCFIDDRHNWLKTVLTSVKTLSKFSYKATDSRYAATNTIERTLDRYASAHLNELTLDRGPRNIVELFPPMGHFSKPTCRLARFHCLRYLETRFRWIDLHPDLNSVMHYHYAASVMHLHHYAAKLTRSIPDDIQVIRILPAHEHETVHQRCIQLQAIVEEKWRLRSLRRVELPQVACSNTESLESCNDDCTTDGKKTVQENVEQLTIRKLQDSCKVHEVQLGWTDPVPIA